MGAVAASMNDAFGDPFVVEMKDFLAEMEIFQSGRAARPKLEGIVVVGNRAALGGGENGVAIFSGLMQFSAFTPAKGLVMNFDGILRSLSSLISS